MYPRGIIYQSGKSAEKTEFFLHPSLPARVFYHLARGVGAGLVAFAIVGIIFSFWPIIKEEESLSKFGEILSTINAQSLGLDPYFSVYVPKISAKSKVIPNVDAGNPKEYLWALSEGVAHAAGTNFPGQGKTIYLFSHSTNSPLNFARYNAVFYLLRKLEKGDRIIIYFLSKKYEYTVTDKITTSADDTSWLNDDGSGERLVLQTCDPPGTSLRRLIVVARPLN